VRAGRDVSDEYHGRFRLRPDGGATGGIDVVLASDIPGECRLPGRGGARLPWSSSTAGRSLGQALAEAGIAGAVPEELEELARAMSGLTAGPKGTVLAGQTELLEVVAVEVDYPIR